MAKPGDDQGGSAVIQPIPTGVAIDFKELTPIYANAAQIQFSPYEFMLTFMRTEYLLQGTGPDGKTPVSIAVRVALPHRAMREFLDAAINNYQMFIEKNPDTEQLKFLEQASDSASA